MWVPVGLNLTPTWKKLPFILPFFSYLPYSFPSPLPSFFTFPLFIYIMLFCSCCVPGCGIGDLSGSKKVPEGLAWWSRRAVNCDREHLGKETVSQQGIKWLWIWTDWFGNACGTFLWDIQQRAELAPWHYWDCAEWSLPPEPWAPAPGQGLDLVREP